MLDLTGLSIRQGIIDTVITLPAPLASSLLFVDLTRSWDKVSHFFITEPRRELAKKRNLFRFEVGDFLIVEKDGAKLTTGRIDHIELGDRGLPELVVDERTDVSSISKDDITDRIYLFFDLYNQQTGILERSRVSILKKSRLERQEVIQYVEMVGFNFLSDDLSTEAFWRISRNTGLYRDEASTNESVKFLSWMINADFFVEYLWTHDGAEFVRRGSLNRASRPDEYEVSFGGRIYFATSRVALRYNAEKTPFINIFKMQELFLGQAPINVVVDRIIAEIDPFEIEPATINGTFTRSRFVAEAV